MRTKAQIFALGGHDNTVCAVFAQATVRIPPTALPPRRHCYYSYFATLNARSALFHYATVSDLRCVSQCQRMRSSPRVTVSLCLSWPFGGRPFSVLPRTPKS